MSNCKSAEQIEVDIGGHAITSSRGVKYLEVMLEKCSANPHLFRYFLKQPHPFYGMRGNGRGPRKFVPISLKIPKNSCYSKKLKKSKKIQEIPKISYNAKKFHKIPKIL